MSPEETLTAALLAATAVTAIVGAGATARIYPDVVPQEVPVPSIGFARLETDFITTIHSGVPIAIDATIEIACMAAGRMAADALCDAVTAAAAAAGFYPQGRRAELDPDTKIWASIVTVNFLQQQ